MRGAIVKEVQKTSIEKTTNVKRQRRRERYRSLCYVIVVLLVLVLCLTLSMTVLFNIKTIRVEGSSEYNASEIVEASKVYKGDNLVRLNTDKAKNNILTTLMYVDDVTIKKDFPNTLTIVTVASVPAMNVLAEDGTYILASEGLKNLSSTNTTSNDGLMQVVGFEPVLLNNNTKVSSNDEQKVKILNTIYSSLKDNDMLSNVVSIDITDKYDIMVNYSNRVYIKLGSYSDLEYKIRYSATVIDDYISEQKTGYLIFINSNSANNVASFVDKDTYEKYMQNLEDITTTSANSTDDSTTQTTEVYYYTDEYGYTYTSEMDTTTTSEDTYNDTQSTTNAYYNNTSDDDTIIYGTQTY